MNNTKDIYPIWKEKGESTHQIALTLAHKLGVKTSHTGTLDPMAEGVIIILAGETRLKKYEYASWLKTYVFEITLGITTDTFDGLGLVTSVDLNDIDVAENDIKNTLNCFKGAYAQKVPPYSAIKVKGKPLHTWAREGKLSEIELPKRKGKIIDIQFLSIEKKKLKETLIDQINIIKKIHGDLRQDKILSQWMQYISQYGDTYTNTIKIKVKITKGLYVRRLGMDILNKLNMPGFVSNLVRTQNGEYDFSNVINTNFA